MADKVVTEHAEANAAVDKLREVATAVRELGDALVQAEGTIEEQGARLADWRERLTEMEDHTATAVRELGDALVQAEGTIEEQGARLADWRERLTEMEDHTETHKRWESLLEDFKRGIVDRDELLAGTIGK